MVGHRHITYYYYFIIIQNLYSAQIQASSSQRRWCSTVSVMSDMDAISLLTCVMNCCEVHSVVLHFHVYC